MFRQMHRALLRQAEAAGAVPGDPADDSGPVALRSAYIGGRPVLVVSLAAPPQELLSDAELASILSMSPRQTAVARLLAQRRTNPEIAAELKITESTVRRHAEHVFLRLGVHTRRDVDPQIRQRVLDALYPRPTARRRKGRIRTAC